MLKKAIRRKILGVYYTHFTLADESDIYITDYGIPFVECLLPDNFWLDKEWFTANSQRLSGTSTLYRVRTKEIGGRQKEIVLKWNRMGQDVPCGDAEDMQVNAEFNSPF